MTDKLIVSRHEAPDGGALMEAASIPAPAPSIPAPGPSRDVPIGTLFFRAGLATAEQIEDALREGMRNGERVGEILVRRGVVQDDDVARMLATQKGLEFEPLDDFEPSPLLVPLLSADAALRHQALPVRRDDGVLTLAIADPTNEVAMKAACNEVEGTVCFAVAPRSKLRAALVRSYRGADPAEPLVGAPGTADPPPEQTIRETPEPAPTPPSERAQPESAEPSESPPAKSANGERLRGVPLGSRILRAGLVAPQQLEEAFREAVATGRRLSEILLERGWIPEQDLARVLAAQKDLPFVELGRYTPDARAVELIPEETAVRHRAVVYGFEGDTALVALADPTDDLAIAVVHAAVGETASLAVATPSDIASALVRAYAATPLSEVDPRAAAAGDEASDAGETSGDSAGSPAGAPRDAFASPAAMVSVTARLSDGDRIRLLEAAEEAAAHDFARQLMRASGSASRAMWPFADGRFIAPGAIMSIDIARIESTTEIADARTDETFAYERTGVTT